ncbi:phosphotransferase [Lachnospiraceae bacterium OttesenSCG-928-D06]|nr:phosphotransferase [Lachnospiraceae bacterium OttesenSCG-928-D06]
MKNIPGYHTFVNIEPITKGWSEDKKYHIETIDGTHMLLRISPLSRYDNRKTLFERLKQISTFHIPMCEPIEFGTCSDFVYTFYDFIEGEDLEAILPTLSQSQQYSLGEKAGKILQKIHTIPAPPTQEDWEIRFNRKMDNKIRMYHECSLEFDGAEHLITYIHENRHLLKNRPQCFQHGDYHVGNMMIENGKLVIIDFDRFDFGDPFEEFNRIVWCAQTSPHFATGMVDGYFLKQPPTEFWRLLALYISSNTLSAIPWAIPFGQGEIDIMLRQGKEVLSWYNNMKTLIPSWYKH